MHELRESDVLNVLRDAGTDLDDDESPKERLSELLLDHYKGVWQDITVLRALQRIGHDGVVSKDPHGFETEYVVFSPKQVKILNRFKAPS